MKLTLTLDNLPPEVLVPLLRANICAAAQPLHLEYLNAVDEFLAGLPDKIREREEAPDFDWDLDARVLMGMAIFWGQEARSLYCGRRQKGEDEDDIHADLMSRVIETFANGPIPTPYC